MKFTEYFLEDNTFKFLKSIRSGREPWSALSAITRIIQRFLKDKEDSVTDEFIEFCQPNIHSISDAIAEECSFSVSRTIIATDHIFLRHSSVFIGRGTTLEAGATIKGPSVIGKNCEIRHGAYVRGGVIVGNSCVIGHVTEIKNSIIMDHTNAGHFNYIGDSILGSYVNMGAGAKLANLQFRTREEIDADAISEIVISEDGRSIATGLKKFGAVIGDYTEIGCNTVTSPAALIGANCWVYPNTTVPKGFYKPGSVIKSAGASVVEIIERST